MRELPPRISAQSGTEIRKHRSRSTLFGRGRSLDVRCHWARLVDTNRSSLLRHAIGFMVGAVLAASSAGFALVYFFPLPSQPNPRDHTGEALMLLSVFMIFSGGLIGRRGFSGASLSRLRRPVIGSYMVIAFLGLMGGDFREMAIMAGFASTGMFCSALGTLILLRFFPLKEVVVDYDT